MTKLPFTPMTSSWISGAHDDPATATLHVQTKGGDTYRVDDFPADKAHTFMGAASPGSAWNDLVKDRHTVTKVFDA